MKHFLLILLLGFSLLGYAQNKKDTVYTVSMKVLPIGNEEEEDLNPQRKPLAPIAVEIDFVNLVVHFSNGLASDDIVSYELCDVNGMPIIVNSDESAFVEGLLYVESGIYVLRFETFNYVITGEICL